MAIVDLDEKAFVYVVFCRDLDIVFHDGGHFKIGIGPVKGFGRGPRYENR